MARLLALLDPARHAFRAIGTLQTGTPTSIKAY
jgi:hypothetical protein